MIVYCILTLERKARSHRLRDLFCTRRSCSPCVTCTFFGFFLQPSMNQPFLLGLQLALVAGTCRLHICSQATIRRTLRCENINTSRLCWIMLEKRCLTKAYKWTRQCRNLLWVTMVLQLIDWSRRYFGFREGSSTNKCIHAFSFLLAKHFRKVAPNYYYPSYQTEMSSALLCFCRTTFRVETTVFIAADLHILRCVRFTHHTVTLAEIYKSQGYVGCLRFKNLHMKLTVK